MFLCKHPTYYSHLKNRSQLNIFWWFHWWLNQIWIGIFFRPKYPLNNSRNNMIIHLKPMQWKTSSECVKRNKQNLFYLTNNLAFKISPICLSLLVLNMLNIFWIEIVIWTLKAKQLVWVGWIFLKRFLFWSCYPHNTIWHTTLQRYTKARKTKLMELAKSKKHLHTFVID